MVDFSQIERILAARPVNDWQPTTGPPEENIRRAITTIPLPEFARPDPITLDEARRRIKEYLMNHDDPKKLLLIKTLPGTGKTTAAVEATEARAAGGQRMAYAGPRHDFFLDLIEKTRHPEWWYEWLPRQDGTDAISNPQTCRHTAAITAWMVRGFPGMDFCAGVCGFDYIKVCPYHLQKERKERIIFLQHQHVALGHPLDFKYLIGDENPAAVFAHEWRIPARWICPSGMADDDPLKAMLFALAQLAGMISRPVQGPEIIEYLGGADAVIEAVACATIPAAAEAYISIHYPSEVEDKPYFHLPSLVQLLSREARQVKAGADYPFRLVLTHDYLAMLLRRNVAGPFQGIPIAWLDATGRPEIYEQIFGRPVIVVDAQPHIQGRIYQVVDRANGKQAITGRKDKPGKTRHADQMETLIERIQERHGYTRPVVIGFKDFVGQTRLDLETGHFYAARGTNLYETADALFVAGAPQSNIYDIVQLAKMIWWERDTAFRPAWSLREVAYRFQGADGLGRAYPVSGFWGDPDLQTLLETIREDEILQAAHRARPVNHPVDIWLLTNIPIAALPPDELLTMREILEAPEGVNIWKWQMVQELMERADTITIKDIEALGISYEHANKYLLLISALPGWTITTVQRSTGGRPVKMVGRAAFNRESANGVNPQSRITH